MASAHQAEMFVGIRIFAALETFQRCLCRSRSGPVTVITTTDHKNRGTRLLHTNGGTLHGLVVLVKDGRPAVDQRVGRVLTLVGGAAAVERDRKRRNGALRPVGQILDGEHVKTTHGDHGAHLLALAGHQVGKLRAFRCADHTHALTVVHLGSSAKVLERTSKVAKVHIVHACGQILEMEVGKRICGKASRGEQRRSKLEKPSSTTEHVDDSLVRTLAWRQKHSPAQATLCVNHLSTHSLGHVCLHEGRGGQHPIGVAVENRDLDVVRLADVLPHEPGSGTCGFAGKHCKDESHAVSALVAAAKLGRCFVEIQNAIGVRIKERPRGENATSLIAHLGLDDDRLLRFQTLHHCVHSLID
mmetsp:Transcript_14776/g.37588  ORF Transcript_14776/g.37588 Transcript_14776/m.37588 type:complete len:358 (+) Transcript_14776:859-1932(+)